MKLERAELLGVARNRALFRSDIDEILSLASEDLRWILDQRILLTGASGFVGRWLTTAWLEAAAAYGGSGKLFCLARDLTFLEDFHPSLVNERVVRINTDIRNAKLAPELHLEAVIHGATTASADLSSSQPFEVASVMMSGLMRLLSELETHPVSRFMFLSSGAVYGRMPQALSGVAETFVGSLDWTDKKFVYHELKRSSESILETWATQKRCSLVNARLFAFLGPYLPLDRHFAAGNFLIDALEGSKVKVNSGGQSVRSYQYPTDLVRWCFKALATETFAGSLNVGSDRACTIVELADAICRSAANGSATSIQGVDTESTLTFYLPDISRARFQLGLQNRVDLDESIARTIRWLTSKV
jgi:nucleoside-diphosphate-sugar epimerase